MHGWETRMLLRHWRATPVATAVCGTEEHQLRPGDEVEQPIHLSSQASSTAEQYAQVGNAVHVRLGRVAGTVLARDLDALREQSWQPYVRRPPAYRIVYVQSHVRTRQWFKDGETFAWRDGETNGHAVYAAPKTRRKSRALTIPARQARAFRVIDNRTSELTSWDTDLLPDALSGLNDLDIFSFDDVLPLAATAGKTDPDDIPETPKNPVSRVGDIWTTTGDTSRAGTPSRMARKPTGRAGTKPRPSGLDHLGDPATARSTCRHRSPETARPVPRPRPARLKVSPHEIGQGRIVRSRLVCAQRPIYFLACRQSSLLDCGPFVRLVHRPICHVAARASEPDRAAPARRLKRQAQPQGRAAPGRVRVRP